MDNSKSYHIQTKVHGSYLIQDSRNIEPAPLIIGFHGYGETAEDQMNLLLKIPGIELWTICSIQALHPFYITRAKIGFSWMTSNQRELRIKENVKYVNSIIAETKNSHSVNDTIIFHGFSQGTAMACRAALLGQFNPSGVILLGGDIPPEMEQIDKMKRILLGRGKKDKFYSSIRWKNDIALVKKSKIESFICEFNGGHGGHKNYYEAAGKFLKYYR